MLSVEALEKEKQLVPVESGMLDSIFDFMSDIASSVETTDLMLTGATNIFNHPEFNSIDRTREFLEFVKKDNMGKLKELIDKTAHSAFTKFFTQGNRAIGHHIFLFAHIQKHVQGNFQNGTNGKFRGLGRVMLDTKIQISVVFKHAVNDFHRARAILFFDVSFGNRLF